MDKIANVFLVCDMGIDLGIKVAVIWAVVNLSRSVKTWINTKARRNMG